MLSITISIILLTAIISFTAFSNHKVLSDLIFHPTSVIQRNQWYRFITSGFIHADLTHLAFNMFTLYFFGKSWEAVYINYLGVPKFMYLVFYFTALIVSDIPSFIKHKNHYNYQSLGASGAVSAVVFSMILLMPWQTLYVFVFPIPAILYAVLYLGYTIYMSKKGNDNINHDAHLWGALYGIVFTIAIKPEIFQVFIQQLMNPKF